jgi:hypothetical protein
MFLATNSPILRSTFWLYIQLWYNAPIGSSVGALYQKLHIVKKCSWGWANLSPETCRADLKRLINEKVIAYCWLLTSLYALHIWLLCAVVPSTPRPPHFEKWDPRKTSWCKTQMLIISNKHQFWNLFPRAQNKPIAQSSFPVIKTICRFNPWTPSLN